MPRTTVNVYPSGTVLGKRTTNQRRNDQNSQMATLGTLLPFPEDSTLTKDKISVIRLTGAYLKFQKFLQDAGISPSNAAAESAQQHSSVPSTSSSSSSSSSSSQSRNSQIFSSLMSKALDGFLMILDDTGTVLFASDDCADYIGLTPPQFIGQTVYELCNNDSQDTIKKSLKLNHGDLIEGNQVWRQFCMRMRSSVSAARTQVATFYRFNMVHVSGFLKVAFKNNIGLYGDKLSCAVVSSSNVDDYHVIGLVAECHLIESPVIMELTIQHSTFTAVTSLNDMKFTSVDTRVKQIVGFDAEDMVGQEIMNFFHPREMQGVKGIEHTQCHKSLMLQGRSISPVHRFLTKSGEWIWMQMCITLLYIPNTNKPYAATHLFRVINKDSSDTGKYKLVEYKERYIKDSNSCLPDSIKPHFPPPTSVAKEQQPPENHIISGLHDTPLSDEAKEAFFQARNTRMETLTAGIKPALTEIGGQPLAIFPDYTENATLKDIFLPSTMTCNETVPYGPELYMPFSNANGNTAATTVSQQPPSRLSSSTNSSVSAGAVSQQPPSRLSSSANSSVSMTAEAGEHNHYNQLQASYSPSSGYQSSPSMPATSPESNLLDSLSPQELNDTDLDKLIESLNSEPQVQTGTSTKSLRQGDHTFDGIIDQLLAENLLNNGEALPDLPIYDQHSYHKHNGN